MTGTGASTRLTVAQVIVRWLTNQFTLIDGVGTRICGSGFGNFGHGNVPCRGEMLCPAQSEQSMGFAAAARAKYHQRRRFVFGTGWAGPGTANLLTAAAFAHANRLLKLMLCRDTLPTLPDPFTVDFAARAKVAIGKTVASPADLAKAFQRAKAATKTSGIVLQVAPCDGWTSQGHTRGETGMLQVFASEGVRTQHAKGDAGSTRQRQAL